MNIETVNGEIARVKDNHLNRVAWTEYDEANRVEKMTVQDGSGWMVYRTVLGYDKLEHVSSQKEEVGGGQFLTTYAYDWDNRVTQVGYGSDAYRIRYTYDSQGRLSKRRVNDGSGDQTATYSYLASGVAIPGLDTNPSTNLVSGISQPGVSFSYGYAGNTDNIVSEVRSGGSYAGTTTYGYDSLGQLTRVNDPVENATWIYNYDRGGNMVSKVKYAYTTGGLGAAQQSIGYAYGDANWKDKLTSYNGVAITYDAIGNVTNDGTWTYTWEGGRQLKGMSYSGASVTYDYDQNGQRVRKVVNGVETKYWVNGAKVVHVVRGSDWLHVYYDGQGRPGIASYNGGIYHYLYNLQGDVIGLVDGSGNVVVEYKYDAWGKVIGKTGNLASTLGYLNPFRYRGYVYDEETGLYYLRSRYYNPGWGRFINADVVLGQVGGLLSHNVFAYCGNNPIAYVDSDGDYLEWNLLPAMNYIHIQVQKDIIARNPTLAMEVPVTYHKESKIANGRIDIADIRKGICWEVKPVTVPVQVAMNQLNGYLTGKISGFEGHLKPGSGMEGNKFVTADGQFQVQYWDRGNGIIQYTFRKQKRENSWSTAKNGVEDMYGRMLVLGIIALGLGALGGSIGGAAGGALGLI